MLTTSAPLPKTPEALAAVMDSTLLGAEASDESIVSLCEEARTLWIRAVCVRPEKVALARRCLDGSRVRVATVIGFPLEKSSRAAQEAHPTLGCQPLAEKQAEIAQTLKDGADELDVVINTGHYPAWRASGDSAPLQAEMAGIVAAAHGHMVKLILETDLLFPSELETLTRLAIEAGISCVKTSTGMLTDGQGATVTNVTQMYQVSRPVSSTCIKASGGIRTVDQALSLLQAGAGILGCSNAGNLVQAFQQPASET